MCAEEDVEIYAADGEKEMQKTTTDEKKTSVHDRLPADTTVGR
jgi:hypothetical protein